VLREPVRSVCNSGISPREVFIDTLVAIEIIITEQHSRMRFNRDQHADEFAAHLGADCLPLIGSAERAHAALIGETQK
jgi:hypothetical protein